MNMSIEDISYDWCMGKPCGKVSRLGNKVYWTMHVNDTRYCESFSITEYNNSEKETREAAEDYAFEWSWTNGIHKNQVRRLPDGIYWDCKNPDYDYDAEKHQENVPTKNTLEVKIDNDYTMLIDFEDLRIVEQYSICKTKGGNKNAKYYAAVSFKGTRKDRNNGIKGIEGFHKFLTGNNMTDHKNRNPMDNRRCNLRETTKKLNNNNRTCYCPGMNDAPPDIERVPGVRLVNDRPGGAWQARIKQDDKERTVSFSINTYGNHEACRLAVEARKKFSEQFECLNSNM